MQQIKKLCQSKLTHMGKIAQHCEFLRVVTEKLRAALPDNIRGHVTVANLERGHLVLHVDSATWATQLRFMQEQIMQIWKQQKWGYVEPQKISIRIQTALPLPHSTPPLLSAHNAALLQEVAKGVQQPELRAALQRLAQHRKR